MIWSLLLPLPFRIGISAAVAVVALGDGPYVLHSALGRPLSAAAESAAADVGYRQNQYAMESFAGRVLSLRH